MQPILLNLIGATLSLPSEHTPSAAVEENRVAPTCTADGSCDSVVYCSGCKTELSRERVTLGSSGHSLGAWYETKAPTPSEAGSRRRDCASCSHFETDLLEPLGYLTPFLDTVAGLSAVSSAEISYSEIVSALALYANLTPDEKAEADEAYRALQDAIATYNAKVSEANGAVAAASEIAFAPICASFSFLAALWFLVKKKFYL